MVKDEIDIVEDWVNYHGNLVGYTNLYIVDNMSTDGTYERLQQFQKEQKINLVQDIHYRNKGDIMTNLMRKSNIHKYDIAFPIDFDEFIVYYDNKLKQICPEKTYEYIQNLETTKTGVIKMSMHNLVLDTPEGYQRAVLEAKYASGGSPHIRSKTFFQVKPWNFAHGLDHGNHYWFCDKWSPSKLGLIHYHCRNYKQSVLKTQNNVTGLFGKNIDLKFLETNTDGTGIHHQTRMKSILTNSYSIKGSIKNAKTAYISLEPMIEYMKKIGLPKPKE